MHQHVWVTRRNIRDKWMCKNYLVIRIVAPTIFVNVMHFFVQYKRSYEYCRGYSVSDAKYVCTVNSHFVSQLVLAENVYS